jgi:hypothetical protein
MRFIAFDGVDKHRLTPVCGPQTGATWVRAVIESLLENHPELQTKPTQELLDSGEKFAYIIGWRYYFGYSEESNGPAHIRTVLNWLFDYPRLLKAIRTGQAILVFADWYEGVFGPRTLTYHHADKFACFCNTYDIPPKNVIFADGNSAAVRYERPQTPRFIYANIFEWLSLSYVNQGPVPAPEAITHPTNKPYRFLSYARHWNTMRQNFTFDLFDRDLLKHGIASCSAQREDGTSDLNTFVGGLNLWTPGVPQERVKAFLQMLPLTLDADLRVNQATSCNVQHHLDTDISIVHETHSNIETVFLSEKTYRAILMKHPFLMMGSPGLLAQLRADGYQTYGSLFDESYDHETDLLKRKEMVLLELARFIRLDTAEREAKLAAAQEIAALNQKHFLTQLDRPRFGRNLIEALKD